MVKRKLINIFNIVNKNLRQFNKKSLVKNVIRTLLKFLGLRYIVKWFKYKVNRIFLYYPNEKLKFFSQFIKNGDLCFDIGAWQGEYTEMFLRMGAKVISIEPQKELVKILNIRYGKNKKVKIIAKAIGEKKNKAILALCEDPAHSQKATLSLRFRTETRYAKTTPWTKFESVSVITLDSLIKFYGAPKFCKIDVEGYEESVLKGLSHPINFISFEFQKELLDIIENCCDHLNSIGEFKYNCTITPLDNNFLFPKWLTAKELYHKLKLQKENILGGDIYAKYIGK